MNLQVADLTMWAKDNEFVTTADHEFTTDHNLPAYTLVEFLRQYSETEMLSIRVYTDQVLKISKGNKFSVTLKRIVAASTKHAPYRIYDGRNSTLRSVFLESESFVVASESADEIMRITTEKYMLPRPNIRLVWSDHTQNGMSIIE